MRGTFVKSTKAMHVIIIKSYTGSHIFYNNSCIKITFDIVKWYVNRGVFSLSDHKTTLAGVGSLGWVVLFQSPHQTKGNKNIQGASKVESHN